MASLSTSSFTESSGILPDFPGAERHKAEVCDVPLVPTGGIWLHGKLGLPARLSLGRNDTKPRFVTFRWCSMAASSFTESSGFLPDFPGAERHKAEVCDVPLVLNGGILPPAGSHC
jgi:hypothetical protein